MWIVIVEIVFTLSELWLIIEKEGYGQAVICFIVLLMFGPEENLRVEDTQEQKTRSGLPLPCIIVKCKQKVRNEAIHWLWCDEIHYPTFANL